MFHPHQDAIADAGCMGQFEVVSNTWIPRTFNGNENINCC
jgi:hypothetical protein